MDSKKSKLDEGVLVLPYNSLVAGTTHLVRALVRVTLGRGQDHIIGPFEKIKPQNS